MKASTDLDRWRNPPIQRLLGTATVLTGNHQNKVWRGITQVPGNVEAGIPTVIKWIEKKEVVATELACSLAGQALKLQIPVGSIVLAEPGDLPTLPDRVIQNNPKSVICYGSELQWPDDLQARPVANSGIENLVWDCLCKTAQGPNGAAWDELVTNEDRHHENVVFDGKKWWLIDHERSLETVTQVMQRFTEQTSKQKILDAQAKQNRLLREVLNRRPTDHNMNKLPKSWERMQQRLRWLASSSDKWKTNIPEVDSVLMMTSHYLWSIDLRLPTLALHLQKRMVTPNNKLQWDSLS